MKILGGQIKKNYCITHKIDYLTTMDFLCAALTRGIFDESRCNNFLQKVLAGGGKLPVKNIAVERSISYKTNSL